MNIPLVIDQSEKGNIIAFDVYSTLLKRRTILIGEPITDEVSNNVISQMLCLNAKDKKTPISLFVNSQGGSLSSAFAIYDIMRFVKPDIHTYCIGQAVGAAVLLLAAGTQGRRFISSHAKIILKEPSLQFSGDADDITLATTRTISLKKEVDRILLKHTNKKINKIKQRSGRDMFLSAGEARKYGLVDKIMRG